MKNKKAAAEKSVETIETTIGELIEAITQIALKVGKSEKEGYELASLAVGDLLKRHPRELSLFM